MLILPLANWVIFCFYFFSHHDLHLSLEQFVAESETTGRANNNLKSEDMNAISELEHYSKYFQKLLYQF